MPQTAKEKPEEESRHHHTHGQRPTQWIVSRLCWGSPAPGEQSAIKATQNRRIAAWLSASPGRQFGNGRGRDVETSGAVALLRSSCQGDAVQETCSVRLAFLQTCRCKGSRPSRLSWHHQAPNGPQHHQGYFIMIYYSRLHLMFYNHYNNINCLILVDYRLWFYLFYGFYGFFPVLP